MGSASGSDTTGWISSVRGGGGRFVLKQKDEGPSRQKLVCSPTMDDPGPSVVIGGDDLLADGALGERFGAPVTESAAYGYTGGCVESRTVLVPPVACVSGLPGHRNWRFEHSSAGRRFTANRQPRSRVRFPGTEGPRAVLKKMRDSKRFAGPTPGTPTSIPGKTARFFVNAKAIHPSHDLRARKSRSARYPSRLFFYSRNNIRKTAVCGLLRGMSRGA